MSITTGIVFLLIAIRVHLARDRHAGPSIRSKVFPSWLGGHSEIVFRPTDDSVTATHAGGISIISRDEQGLRQFLRSPRKSDYDSSGGGRAGGGMLITVDQERCIRYDTPPKKPVPLVLTQ